MSREIGQLYYERFIAWRDRCSDDDFLRIVNLQTRTLNRQEIMKEAEISEQAIKKNDRIKNALRELEEELRERGVLEPLTKKEKRARSAPKLYDTAAEKVGLDAKRVSQLEAQVQDLQAQLAEARKDNERLRARLSAQYETVEAINDLLVFTQCPS